MAINKLLVENFRNLENQLFEFDPKITCLFGQNGNGKTNVLEAITYLLTGKSFRKNTSFPQIISVEAHKNEILFQAIVTIDEKNLSVSGKVTPDSEYWYVNNELVKKRKLNPSIFINPFDSYSFHTSSTFRRQWIDQQLSYLSPIYKKNYSNYTKALRFRNSLLQQGRNSSSLSQLVAIDEQFYLLTSEVMKQRKEFLEELNEFISPTFKRIFDEIHEIKLEMNSSFDFTDLIQIKNFYDDRLNKDFLAGITTKGAHRDDFIFMFDGLNSYEFCSLGQQKMAFLSLLFAYIELFRYKFKSYPIVLIDDVSGELDMVRWNNLMTYLAIKPFQTIMTTANNSFKRELQNITQALTIEIKNGSPYQG